MDRKEGNPSMNLKRTWLTAVGVVLVSGALLTGTASAKPEGAPSAPAEQRQPTAGEQELMEGLRAIRKNHREAVQRESRALIDKAAKDGKITQEQAARLQERLSRFGLKHGKLTRTELQKRLAEKVKEGKLTQEQAERILKRWDEKHKQ